jgi:hypothetical protein
MLTPEQEDMFQALLQRTNVTAVSVTPRIAAKAREIRDYYQTRGVKIAVPDSIHLATAIQYKATALHTYDGGGKRRRQSDLMQLATPLIEKYPLTVTKPEPPAAEVPEAPETGHIGGLFDEPPTEVAPQGD